MIRPTSTSRRHFLATLGGAGITLAVPASTLAYISKLKKPVKVAFNPLSPPSDPVQRRLQSPSAKSKFLAVR